MISTERQRLLLIRIVLHVVMAPCCLLTSRWDLWRPTWRSFGTAMDFRWFVATSVCYPMDDFSCSSAFRTPLCRGREERRATQVSGHHRWSWGCVRISACSTPPDSNRRWASCFGLEVREPFLTHRPTCFTTEVCRSNSSGVPWLASYATICET